LIFIKPKDLPEIAHFLGKVFYRGKRFFGELKKQFREVEQDLGLEEIKQEINRGMAEEKAKLEDEMTVIVDMYGNEHHVGNVHTIRSDLTKEQLEEEVKKLNQENSADKKLNSLTANQKPIQKPDISESD
jgi:Sec-independent protein translocase protein TatA